MPGPVSVRLPRSLQAELARYCQDQGVSRSEAIARGVRLLVSRPRRPVVLTADRAIQDLRRRRQKIRLRFDAAAAGAQGRD